MTQPDHFQSPRPATEVLLARAANMLSDIIERDGVHPDDRAEAENLIEEIGNALFGTRSRERQPRLGLRYGARMTGDPQQVCITVDDFYAVYGAEGYRQCS